jgi:hypothetical protein
MCSLEGRGRAAPTLPSSEMPPLTSTRAPGWRALSPPNAGRADDTSGELQFAT